MNLRSLWPFGRKSASDSLELFREIYSSRTSKSGQLVGIKEAIRCATVFACARVIATGIAQVPLKLYRENEATEVKLPARDHPLYRILHRKPNPWQTSYEFREMIGLHLALAGRAYCFKTIVGGQIRELIPFEPGKVMTNLASDGVTVIYSVAGRDGITRQFDSSLIWHIKGASWNGWEGLDALDLAREAVGLSIAAETSQSRLHEGGVRPSGVYSVDGTLNPEQHKQLRKFLQDNYAGESSGLPMIVDRGAKWLSTAMSGVDAQHLETRRFQVEEVCRSMGVMPIMVYQSDKAATYASAEAMFQAHVIHTLAPWWERIEQSIDCNLLTEADDRAGVYAKFVGQGLLRGSMKDRADYFAKALGSGGSPAWMTQDEVRRMEEMNPMGGDAARLPVATNVPAPVDPRDEEEAMSARLALAEVKAAVQHLLHAPPQIPAPAPQPIEVKAGAVSVTMPPITLHMPAAGEIKVDATSTINVPPAQIHVEAPNIVNVPAAQVKVDAPVTVQMPSTMETTIVSMPSRSTETSVKFDKDKRIVGSTATEKDQ